MAQKGNSNPLPCSVNFVDQGTENTAEESFPHLFIYHPLTHHLFTHSIDSLETGFLSRTLALQLIGCDLNKALKAFISISPFCIMGITIVIIS